ncbi:DUF3157 family protein [Aquimarina agarilytica]|uniref:DUF3157 family protein n=1 Tax=Aquimarina agarilytica TaxID=1087449 RepID=UPI00030CF3DC|nr:DUF3157 family protein [Aquimarina agarilytica]
MRKCLFVVVLFLSFLGYSQDNYIVKTDDGRRVLLKADFTWEYIDLAVPAEVNVNDKEAVAAQIAMGSGTKNASVNTTKCNTLPDFKEPKGDRVVQAHLKKGRATIKHIKKKVAKDNNCAVEDVLLLKLREQKNQGSYTFCANGKQVVYKRTGFSFAKKGKLF